MKLSALALLAAASAAAPAKVLRVCDDVAPPASLDPSKTFAEKNQTLIQQIYDGLVRFDPDGRIQPALAVGWSRLDDRTMEFRLREGVKFHNGEPLDAEAVRASIERFLDPRVGFPGAGFLASIEKAEPAGPHAVRIRTRFPDGLLLHRLAGFVNIMPRGALAADGGAGLSRRPVGTGAFRFVSADERRVVLEANPEYWGGRPRFDRLSFEFLPVDKQVEGLLKGEIDLVTELPGTSTLRVMRSGSAHIVKKESFYTVGGSVNVSSGPLSDVRVRRALNHAIDRAALVRYDLRGNGRPLATLTMPGEPGHDPGLEPYAYDPAKARRLLAEAGYPKGVRLKVVVKVQGERTLQIIETQLKRVGITLDKTLTTDAAVIRDIRSGGWDFTFGGCPDPLAHSFFVQFIFLSSDSPYSITRDPGYDRRLGALVSTLEPRLQEEAGRELDRYMHEQALSVFTYQRIKTYGVSRQVRFVPWVTGMPYFHASSPAEHAQR